MSRSLQRFTDFAVDAGIDVDVVEFPQDTRTAEQAAAAIGCEVGEIVKSLVFIAGEEPVLVLISGDRKVDVDQLGTLVASGRARRADLDEVKRATGYAAGGTPPFGHVAPLLTFVDRSLRRHERVWTAAGIPTAVFPISVDDLVSAAGAIWCDVSERGPDDR